MTGRLYAQEGTTTTTPIPTPVATKEKTAFQTSAAWMPQIDVRADIAIVYGVSERGHVSFEDRVKSWRNRGYQVHFMTGIAWGQYDDDFFGIWIGQKHMGEVMVTVQGDNIS